MTRKSAGPIDLVVSYWNRHRGGSIGLMLILVVGLSQSFQSKPFSVLPIRKASSWPKVVEPSVLNKEHVTATPAAFSSFSRPEASSPSNTGIVPRDELTQRVTRLFARRCLTCHSSDEAEGGFVLETRADLIDGGYVEEGAPDASYLVDLIEHAPNEVAEMPKDAEPLTRSEIDDIRRWITEGANWPEDLVLEPLRVVDRDWWSLQPMTRPLPPTIQSVVSESSRWRGWSRNPIDDFVIGRMLEHGLSPSPPADRAVLLRRLFYDLIGLPPTPDQIRDFVDDPAPDAYERRVDQLLASPQYGERWARHWLDVVHYADTHGYDKDKLRLNAWPYRDYVIRAFNEDRPYDRFVREQIAGDVLFPSSIDGPVATGFIAAGPWDFIGHAEVPESKRDGQVARALDRDDMVTTTLNSFCSLTIQCARCHHHKLDPVMMEDYYRLQAVFAAIDRADRDYDTNPEVARTRHELQVQQQTLQQTLTQLQTQFEQLKPTDLIELDSKIVKARTRLEVAQSGRPIPAGTGDGEATETLGRSDRYGFHSQVAASQDEPKWVQVDLGRSRPIDRIWLFGADEYGFADFGFPEAFRVEVSDDAQFRNAQLLAEMTATNDQRPGGRAMEISGGEVEGRYVRVTATRLWQRRKRAPDGAENATGEDWIFALGELLVSSQNEIVTVVSASAKDSIESMPRWGLANLTDRVIGRHLLDRYVLPTEGSPTNGYHSEFASAPNSEKWIQLDFGKPTAWDGLELIPAFPTDWQDVPGFGFPAQLRIEVSNDAQFDESRLVEEIQESSQPIPGGHSRLVLNDSEFEKARYLRITATSLWDRGQQQYAFAMGELRVLSAGENIASLAALSASDSIEGGRWGLRYLVDNHTSRIRADQTLSLVASFASPADIDEQRTTLRTLETQRRDLIADMPALNELAAQVEESRAKLADVQASINRLPDPLRVYAGTVHEGSGAFRGRAGLGPREIHVLHRGDVSQPRALVQPGTVPLLEGEDGRFDLPEQATEGDRRVALANWIVRADHPLTWRSIANRVWQYHFGTGLVESPNDFGHGGQLPTHPQLLDWLALELRDNDRSLKHLHRLICTSATYQQTSRLVRSGDDTVDPLAVDANNRWLWRMNRRRLSAEETRDSFLMLAGLLDERMGGPGFQDFVIEHPEHSPHYEYDKYDLDDHATHRRAIYRFIVRSQPQPLMTALDCADPSISVPVRDETLTAIQALALMNNRFATYVAQRWSERLEREHDSLRNSLKDAFLESTLRPATDDELNSLEAYAEKYGLANACRVLLNLNEVVFID